MHSRTLTLAWLLCTACISPEPQARREQRDRNVSVSADTTKPRRATQPTSTSESFRQVDSIPQLIGCGAEAHSVCLPDSTRGPDECCTGDVIGKWILVLNRSDSLEFFVGPGTGARRADASITMEQVGRGRSFQEHDVNTASYLRYRFPEPGAFALSVGLPNLAGDTVPYELRIRQTSPTFDPNAIHGSPLAFLDADSSARLAVLPERPPAGVAAGFPAFQVRPGWYRLIAPGVDSVFVCRLPCTRVLPVALATRAWHAKL